ncbi:DNA replication licensing factor Mcm7-like [Culex pipiens pallens]|uniref:DNA replication licensing factor Mcm7-like n=1 Tax=Culex pipiens pallens TaxID=42434 RepID=UPI001954879C|nr:DNA replication licensing factor Mcm7-like [Culex pipiens pallens]
MTFTSDQNLLRILRLTVDEVPEALRLLEFSKNSLNQTEQKRPLTSITRRTRSLRWCGS